VGLLEQTVADLPAGAPVLLFLHKPVWPELDEPIDHQLDLLLAAWDRLLALVEGTVLRVVGSGHLHTYRHHQRGDVVEVWSPLTAFAAVDGHGMLGGLSEIGYVEHVVENGAVEANYHSVPGLTRALGENIPQVAAAMAAALTAAGASAPWPGRYARSDLDDGDRRSRCGASPVGGRAVILGQRWARSVSSFRTSAPVWPVWPARRAGGGW